MIVEGMRTDSLYIGGTNIRVSQALSFCIVLVCGVLLTALLIKYTRHPKPIEGVDFFPPKTEKELAAEQKKLERKKRRAEMKNVKIVGGKMKIKNKEQEEDNV